MTDRDKLIHKIMSLKNPMISLQTAMDIVDAIIDYDVILPPCKVGDIVYTIFEGDIEALKIIYAKTEESTESIRKYYDAENKFLKMPFSDCHIGKSIFLTKEEAEEKLKELKDNAT